VLTAPGRSLLELVAFQHLAGIGAGVAVDALAIGGSMAVAQIATGFRAGAGSPVSDKSATMEP
jgi:hypothetical protein